MAFDKIKARLLQRLNDLFSQKEFAKQIENTQDHQNTQIHTAIMKAVCHSQQWIKKVDIIANQNSKEFTSDLHILGKTSENRNYDCRLLVIQLGWDDPKQFNSLINATFASQKLKICIDCLVLDLTEEQAKLSKE